MSVDSKSDDVPVVDPEQTSADEPVRHRSAELHDAVRHDRRRRRPVGSPPATAKETAERPPPRRPCPRRSDVARPRRW